MIYNIYDVDIGKDPDDTVVVAMLALNKDFFNPSLIITNDETPSFSRARWASSLVTSSDNDLKIAAGLPSLQPKHTILVEREGLITGQESNFEQDGITALSQLIDTANMVNYFGLGALTNLNEVLTRHPEFSEKINLIQMGPCIQGVYRKPTPQYNVRLDPGSFRRVLLKVRNLTLMMSHTSWKQYEQSNSRQELGIYVDDPLYKALEESSNVTLNLTAKHLHIWKQSGVPCSIMHDPLTILSQFYQLVEYQTGSITMDQQGFVNLTPKTVENLREIPKRRTNVLADYLYNEKTITDEPEINCKFSLSVEYGITRNLLVQHLFTNNSLDESNSLSESWKTYNRSN